MSRLAGTIDGVIGVDTHRDTLAAAVTDPVGGVLAQLSVSADAAGYQRLIGFARAEGYSVYTHAQRLHPDPPQHRSIAR